ncbi:hypothetical protein [Clostridium sp.]|uniref:hypothetical protein n=1 Tax=Clostridium sp. TaxID=1506 RepID=UPI001DB66BDA|nr:hypothetical protein [Clostridium sp.]MBS5305733.1 hypothetical protein [Clostridium sp.]
MNLQEYKNIIKNTIYMDIPNYLKQKLINEIKENNVGKYGTKEIDGIVKLTGMADHNERINTCLDRNNLTIKLFDLLEIKRGYRYSILYKYDNIDFNEFKEKISSEAINIDSEYYDNYEEKDIKVNSIQYYEDKEHFFIKFHKSIYEIDKKTIEKKYLRYPILFVFHKNINLFEVRFDRLAYDADYSFYYNTMNARLLQLKSIFNFEYEYFDIETTIREIVENYRGYVKEIIWSFETAKSKGLTLRVGEDGIMPFIGDLEPLVKSLRNKYNNDNNVEECLSEIEDYIEQTKRFANEKFRILSWLKLKNNGENLDKSIDLKIIFNYYKKGFALLNIYDNEINDMERIDHVIRFIGEIAKDIGEL